MTHKAKVLALLSDGQWHSYKAGYALGVMLHSRVADLRRAGYIIVCDKRDGGYWYRLLSKPGPAEAVTSSDGVGVQRVARADVGASAEPGLANGGNAPAPSLFDAQRFVDGYLWEREPREAVQRRHAR